MEEETNKILGDAESILRTTETPGWSVIMDMLNKTLEANSSIMDLENTSPEEMFKEIASRQIAIKLVKDWISQIDGSISNYKTYNSTNYIEKENGIIRVSG